MTTAFLSAALAVLLWPDRGARRSRRLAWLGLPSRPPTRKPWDPDRLSVPLAVAAAATGIAAVVSTPLVALVAGVAAAAAARSWVAARRHRAEEALLAGLAEGLGALTAELRTGRPLESACAAAVIACGDEASGRVLARAVRAPEPRRRPAAAATASADAITSTEHRLSAAVRLSARTGCSLADVVAAVDDDLRARRRHQQELRSATAAPRASAMLLAGLPLLGIAMGSGIGADPWHVLTATGTGQALLVAGVALELAGLAWSRRLVARALR